MGERMSLSLSIGRLLPVHLQNLALSSPIVTARQPSSGMDVAMAGDQSPGPPQIGRNSV
jgi:hypothetical protein